MTTRFAVLLVSIAACGGPKEKGSAKECFGYTMPAGWAAEESKTKADLVLAAGTGFPLGDHGMRDNFIIRYIPWDASLDAFETQFLSMLTQSNIDQLVAEQAREHPNVPALKSGAPTPKIVAATVGGHEAFLAEVRNTIAIGDTPSVWTGTTAFVKFGPEVVSIAMTYVESREAIVKPLATSFLASINFDRCK